MTEKFLGFVSIQLKKNRKEALYVQLYQFLRQMIEEGRLTHGYLLPPVRKFAAFLGINPGTVTRAYKELERNDYLFSREGSGHYVAELSGRGEEEKDDYAAEETDALAVVPPDVAERYINLASVALNPDIVSVENFKRVLIEVLDRDQGYAFGYQESQGFYPLRESIAAYLQASGIRAAPCNVQIISGAQQGIDIVAKTFLQYGDYVFTERPTYPGAVAAFRSRGAKIVEISLEEDGMRIEELEGKLRTFRPKLIYVMPNIQNPTGCSYSPVKRNRLMGLARYYGALILEDDYISELAYGVEPMAPLKAIDRDDRVIYLKSFSKIFMPGLRLAFLTIPQEFVERLSAMKQNSDISTSGLTQRAFDLYLRKGLWQRHIRQLREVYQEQYAFALSLISENFPASVRCAAPSGGLSLWLTLPEGKSAHALTVKARAQGVLIAEGGEFFPRKSPDRYFRISFATASRREIETGIRVLGKLLSEHF